MKTMIKALARSAQEQRLKELGIDSRQRLNLAHLSGSSTDGQSAFSDRDAPRGQNSSGASERISMWKLQAAHLAALAVENVGSLDKVTRVVALGVSVGHCSW